MRNAITAKLEIDRSVPLRRRVAAYVRMSREHQQYSVTNQIGAIGEYAERHDMEIVKIYEDAAKSGLSLRGRDALAKLLQDIESHSAEYSDLLVYDVSRWGRFQDTDEGGHYEFLCRNHGVNVVYCAEDFVNDGSVGSVIVKTYKRAYAADFSRQLSVKVFTTQCLLASRGHSPGSTCPYGLKRVAVDLNGRRRKTLRRGHLKDVDSDHVVLAPGASNEVQIIQEVFDLFVRRRCSARGIARHLNAALIPGPSGKKWKAPTILHILRCDKYIGTQFYNRTSAKLQKPRTENPRELWIQKEEAFNSIIDASLFERAQRLLLPPYKKRSDEELLAGLRRHLEIYGAISGVGARAQNGLANLGTYRARFGSLRRACELAGFTKLPNFQAYDDGIRKRSVRLRLLDQLSRTVEAAGAVLTFTATAHRFNLGGQLTGYFDLKQCAGDANVAPYWRLRFPKRDVIDLYVFGRLIGGDAPMDYFAIPRAEALAPTCTLHMTDRRLDRYRHANLAKLGTALAAALRPVFRRASREGRTEFN